MDALTVGVWKLIRGLDAKLKVLNSGATNLKVTVSVLRNKDYSADFRFCGDNNWWLRSPQRNYRVEDPSLDYLLEKYARLMDPDFNKNVGDHALYDTEEDYVKASQRYVQSNRDKFLQGFIGCLEKVVNSLKS